MPLFFTDKKSPLHRIKKGDYTSRAELQELFKELHKDPGLKISDIGWALTDERRDVRTTAGQLVCAKPMAGTAVYVFKEAIQLNGAPQRALFSLFPKMADTKVLDVLTKQLDGKHAEAAAQAILQFHPSKTYPILVQFLEMDNPTIRSSAIDKIASEMKDGQKIDKRIGELMVPLLDDKDEDVRVKAFELLAKAPSPQFIDQILDRIRKERFAAKKRLVAILENLSLEKNPRILDKLIPLLSEGDDLIRNATLTIATKAGNPADVVMKIIVYSKSLMGWMRDRINRTIGEFGTKLLSPVIELMGHKDPEIRSSALLFAVNFPSPRLVEPCIKMLSESDWWTRALAIDTLGQLGDSRAVEPLTKCLADPEIRWSVVEALTRIGSPQSIGHIAKLLDDPMVEVRIEVLRALEIFKDKRALPLLKKVYKEDDDLRVREAALSAYKNVTVANHMEVDDAELHKEFGVRTESNKKIDLLLTQTRKMGASDFHLTTGSAPIVRTNAELKRLGESIYTAKEVAGLIDDIVSPSQRKIFAEELQADFCYEVDGVGRYRVNIFQQRVGPGAVFRVIENQIPTFTSVRLPEHLEDIANIHQGLVIVSGAAGSGKTTTLAALVDLFNERKRNHVLTLEDPIEYIHPVKNCLISQREIPTHSVDFPTALRAALREDPDVIVVGEMRDPETMRLAITASETGHLVIATMHTTSAYKSVSRLIDSFAPREQPQVRMMLSESLKAVVNQTLLPRKDGNGRVACFEVLLNTGAVGNLIRDNKLNMIPSLMTIGFKKGMRTVDDALRELATENLIAGEEAYLRATNKEDFESFVSPEFLEGIDV